VLQCRSGSRTASASSVRGPRSNTSATDFYDSGERDRDIAWNDPALAIAWPIDQPLLSERDRRNPSLAQLLDRLPEWIAPAGRMRG
jgi:hypothetical protein